eukprot:16444292-Heterocapsa_arctica.AAC.1
MQQAVLQEKTAVLAQHIVETGGEDMPEAFRWVPADPREGAFNIVAAFCPTANSWRFQEMHGQ